MAIDNTDDWSGASLLMCKMVKEGRKFSWKKSYADTKNKKVNDDFDYRAIIYEVRQSRYLNVRMLGRYDMKSAHGLDELCSDLFSLSLTHKLIAVDAQYLEMVVEKSNNGQTNIDESVMEAMMDIQKKIDKQLSRRKPRND